MAQRFEGKNLEEALEAAGAALGVERYQLSYRVLVEKRGFLGGVKRVVVEAEKNDSATPPHERSSFGFDLSGNDTPASQPRRERGRGGRSRASGREERRGGDSRRNGRHERGGRRDERRSDSYVAFDDGPVEIPEQQEQSAFAAEVAGWFRELFRLSQLELEVRTTESDDAVMVQMYGADTRRLVDRGGDLMDAIQVVANKSFSRRDGAKDIECDARNYKEQREAELQSRARRIADQVRRDGREQTLPAMSPVERRIVHLALSDDAEVTTESRGEGFFKRVAIVPRGAARLES